MRQLTEHLSKQLLATFGVPVIPGRLVADAGECGRAAEELGFPVMVKTQLPVNGRGKLGGILRADDRAEAERHFGVVTALRADGLATATARVEPLADHAGEMYLAVLTDPDERGPVVVFSEGGGVDVEESGQAARVPVRPDATVPAARLRGAVAAAGGNRRTADAVWPVAEALARAQASLDAVLVEVNPLVAGADGGLLALDARVFVDESALHRQPVIKRALAHDEPRRIEDDVKDEHGLDYVRLGGSLGLISGGAGMTMAVMDLIADKGGSPACFLDCSANPTKDGYGAAFDLLERDDGVQAILVSIFGGLTLVDRVAKNLVSLLAERDISKPVTIRLMGTNVEGAEAILADAAITNHRDLEDAVETAVASLGRAADSPVGSG